MTSWSRVARLLVLVPTLLILASCSDSKKGFVQKGSISFKGQPLQSGVVRFHMADNRVAIAMIQPDGTFEATDVLPGEVKVTLDEDTSKQMQKMGAPKSGGDVAVSKSQPTLTSAAIPKKYRNTDSSNLSFTLKEGAPLDIKID